MADVINLFEHKTKAQNFFNLEQASADVAHYEKVVMKSVEDFHTYSVQQKNQLYSDLAAFNVQILHDLLERIRND